MTPSAMSADAQVSAVPVRDEIARMKGYVPGEQPQAGKFIKLNTNENPYPPSSKVLAAIRQRMEQGLSKYPDPVATPFRLRAAELYGVDPNWVLCGNGSDDVLTILARTIVGPGDALAFPLPSYILYRTLAQLQGARHEEVPFANGGGLDPAPYRRIDRLKLAFLPNPNSPTGTYLSPESIESFAAELPCPLVVDEAYADFAEGNCIELVKRCPNVLVTRTLSKSYALAGLRFGFVIAQPAWIEQLMKAKDSYNCDALSIAGATAAIDDQAWLAETTAKIKATRGRLERGLADLGFRVLPSQANFVWCDRPDRDARQLYEKLKAERILVRYMEYPGWGSGLRISVGDDAQNDALLTVLKGIL